MMNRTIGIPILFGAVVAAAGMMQAAESEMPDWAYAIPIEPAPERPPEDGTLLSLPGSDFTFTRSKIRGRSDTDENVRIAPADWYPGDHPEMPDIVANGDQSRNVIACALCHYPNGKGRPENASPAGLPKDYFVQQMRDFQNGLRESAEPRKNNYVTMINIAKGMTDEEIEESAEYFSSMPWTKWIEVIETDTVPKTRIQGGMHLVLEGDEAGTEPIGNRIIETPENTEHTEVLRDPRSGFIAYAPVGAVAKGENLVTTGGAGKTIQCGICHGEDLHGLGTVPGIAARSPSYLVRQLYDIQQGKRRGNMGALMVPVVANLTSEDMVNIAAYTASLPAPAIIEARQ
jgi:cytochrome c553